MDSPNLYAFAANDPVNGRDPLGLCWGGLTGSAFCQAISSGLERAMFFDIEGQTEERIAQQLHLTEARRNVRRQHGRMPGADEEISRTSTSVLYGSGRRTSSSGHADSADHEMLFFGMGSSAVRSAVLMRASGGGIVRQVGAATLGAADELVAEATIVSPGAVVRGAGRFAEALLKRQRLASEALAPLVEAFPGARVGFRGSLARGRKGPHKGGAPFDPDDYDVDAFVVSDELAALVSPNAQGFRNLARLPQHRALVSSVYGLIGEIPGVRRDTFKVRVFSSDEFAVKVGLDESFLVGGR